MKRYDYLIVGGGMTADAAVKGIREVDRNGSIALLTLEADPPYARPPLSKDLWNDETSVEEIDCGTAAHGVDILTECRAETLNTADHIVEAGGDRFHYHRLLLATGGRPKRLPFDHAGTTYYRTLADYRALRNQCETADRFAVIGGGFIGSEIAAALTKQNKQVAMIFPEDMIGSRFLPDEVAEQLTGYYREKGVEILSGLKLSGLENQDEKVLLKTESGQQETVDAVVAGLGITPNTELAESGGLQVDDGIAVNGLLQAGHEDIFAAGDVANFHNAVLGTRMRVEHEDNALQMGRHAGSNMAGMHRVYNHLPSFYSDLFDVGYEALGELNPDSRLIGAWSGLQEKGIWAYLRKGRVRGLLFWNLFGRTDAGRSLLADRTETDEDRLRDRLREWIEAA